MLPYIRAMSIASYPPQICAKTQFLKKFLGVCFRASYKTKSGCYGYIPQVEERKPTKASLGDVDLRLEKLVSLYRSFGHIKATVNPLQETPSGCLELEEYIMRLPQGFLEEKFALNGLLNMHGREKASGQEIVQFLEQAYCQNITIELHQVADYDEQLWLGKRFEESLGCDFSKETKQGFLKELLHSMLLDQFLAKKFPTLKRYSGEGADSLLPFLIQSFEDSMDHGVEFYTLCIAHRGRSNLLTGLLNLPPAALFSKVRGNPEFPDKYHFTGDVLSHLVSARTLRDEEKSMRVSMLPNPSHLEAVNPVAMGKARASEMSLGLAGYGSGKNGQHGDKVIVTQVHGDAAFCGQGVNMETLALSRLPHFNIGGSVHLITNNQIGFTTPTERAKSSHHGSDLGKINNCPVIRVNGEYPEEVARASRIATDYRMKFKKDIIVDMMCYRRWGHNELDNPSLTQPKMYSIVESKEPVPLLYAKQLISEGVVSQSNVDEVMAKCNAYHADEHTKSELYQPADHYFGGVWEGMKQARQDGVSEWQTGCDADLLRYVGTKSVEVPEGFSLHSSLKQGHCEGRTRDLFSGTNINWATAEALAFGTLLTQGYNIRLCGQDVGRGTFSHRHAMLVDQVSEDMHIPLNHIDPNQAGHIEIVNSLLSEEAVLAYEYGFSVDSPKNLVIWEAQFGDFFNTSQVIVDTFIASGEAKWMLQSGLVLLLPNGFDGAGPEHSSCRIERFLQMTDSSETSIDSDEVNMEVVYPTMPSQYFHLLRRQLLRDYRKPLIIASPKLTLRLKAATSSLADMGPNTTFQPVLDDQDVSANEVKRILFCSGKHYFALSEHRRKNNISDTAIVRLESLCPFPAEGLKIILAKYTNATDFVWSQEEHRNAGPWSFVRPRFENLLNVKLSYTGRKELASVATGVVSRHQAEAKEVVERPFVK